MIEVKLEFQTVTDMVRFLRPLVEAAVEQPGPETAKAAWKEAWPEFLISPPSDKTATEIEQAEENLVTPEAAAEAEENLVTPEAAAEHEARTGRPAPAITIPKLSPAWKAATRAESADQDDREAREVVDKLYAGVETIPGLNVRGRNGFKRAGFPTVRSLCDLTESKAKALKEVSGASVKAVKAYLASIGQEFADEESADAPEPTAPLVTTAECNCGDSFIDDASLAQHLKHCQAADPTLDRPTPPAPTADNPFGAVPPAAAAPAEVEAAPAPAAGDIPDDALRTAIATVHKARSMVVAQALLAKFGVVKLPDMPQAQRAEFVTACAACAAEVPPEEEAAND